MTVRCSDRINRALGIILWVGVLMGGAVAAFGQATGDTDRERSGVQVAAPSAGKTSGDRPPMGMCPLRGGVIKLDTSGWKAYSFGGHRNPGIEIEGEDSLVISASGGIVLSIFSVGDSKAVMIRSGTYYYTYSNLDTLFANKGDSVKAGQRLGLLAPQMPLEFIFSTKNGMSPWKQEKYVACKVQFVQLR